MNRQADTGLASLQYEMESALGNVYLIASQKGLQGVYWDRREVPMIRDPEGEGTLRAHLRQAEIQVGEYLEGRRRSFELALDFAGTPFQETVWRALRDIPFGATVSYKTLAASIRNPKAVRAVGGANGKNPLCIIIPCHRVIAADGTIGGYAGGIAIKEKLLALERR
jgi:methylated-DNA-[protein]-cysteine S-methyltransferase